MDLISRSSSRQPREALKIKKLDEAAVLIVGPIASIAGSLQWSVKEKEKRTGGLSNAGERSLLGGRVKENENGASFVLSELGLYKKKFVLAGARRAGSQDRATTEQRGRRKLATNAANERSELETLLRCFLRCICSNCARACSININGFVYVREKE